MTIAQSGASSIPEVLMRRDTFFLSLAIVFGANIFALVLGFLRQIFFARWMGPDAFGVFGLALSFQNVLLPLLLLGSGSSLVRFVSLYPKHKRFLLRSILPIPLVFTLVAAGLCLMFREFLSLLVFRAFLPDVILWTVLTLPVLAVYNLSVYASQGQQSFRLIAAANVITAVALLGFGLILVMPKGDETGALITNLISFLMGAIVVGTVFLKGSRTSRDERSDEGENLTREIWSYQGWFFLSEIFFSATNGGVINRWFINFHVSSEASGIFFASLIFGMVIATPISLLNSVLFPKLSEQLQESPETTREKFKNGVFLVLLLYLFFSILVLFFKDPILRLILGSEYQAIADFLHVIIVAYGFFTLVYLNNALLLASGDSKFSFFAFLIGTSVNVVTNIVLTPSWGVMGSALALAAGFGTTAFIIAYRNATTGALGTSYFVLQWLPVLLFADAWSVLRFPLFSALLICGVFFLWKRRSSLGMVFNGFPVFSRQPNVSPEFWFNR